MGGEGTTLDSLLAWLLPEISCGGEESGGASGSGGHMERRERGDPRMFAELLFRLAQNRFQAGPTLAEDNSRGGEGGCNDGLEDRLLEASLIKTMVKRSGDKVKNSNPNTTWEVDEKGVFIDKEALEKITSSLLGDVSSVLDAFDGSGPCIVSGIHEVQILLAFLDSSNNNNSITTSRTMLLTQRLWTKLLASTAKLLLSSKKSENNSFENKLTLLTAWESLVETVGGLRCSALHQALWTPSAGKHSSLLDLVNVVEEDVSKVLDGVEAAASCAKADAERPASAAAADPFDDFETASSSGSNSLLAAESFDRQMSDVVDRSLEESRVRYLNMAFTTIAKVPYPTTKVPAPGVSLYKVPYFISFRVLFLR
jgi:hypothetical protein